MVTFRGRHDLVGVVGEHPPHQFAPLRLAGHDGGLAGVGRPQGRVRIVQPQAALPLGRVRPVALEAVVRQDRPHLPVVVDGGRGRRGGAAPARLDSSRTPRHPPGPRKRNGNSRRVGIMRCVLGKVSACAEGIALYELWIPPVRQLLSDRQKCPFYTRFPCPDNTGRAGNHQLDSWAGISRTLTTGGLCPTPKSPSRSTRTSRSSACGAAAQSRTFRGSCRSRQRQLAGGSRHATYPGAAPVPGSRQRELAGASRPDLPRFGGRCGGGNAPAG